VARKEIPYNRFAVKGRGRCNQPQGRGGLEGTSAPLGGEPGISWAGRKGLKKKANWAHKMYGLKKTKVEKPVGTLQIKRTKSKVSKCEGAQHLKKGSSHKLLAE